MRESAEVKGRRYLTEGRLTLRHVGPDGVAAIVRGDGAWHRAGYAEGRWYCSCPAISTNCWRRRRGVRYSVRLDGTTRELSV